jgi:uncharacterized protein DUF6356
MVKVSFTKHPTSVGESYLEHMGVATGFGMRMIIGGLACLVHGVLPCFFETTGSRAVGQLYDRMVKNRIKPKVVAPSSEPNDRSHDS